MDSHSLARWYKLGEKYRINNKTLLAITMIGEDPAGRIAFSDVSEKLDSIWGVKITTCRDIQRNYIGKKPFLIWNDGGNTEEKDARHVSLSLSDFGKNIYNQIKQIRA